ncbi:MAG: DUF4160 domain-containing protein [Magnetococcales bacterium]|nr:DUF4160 domain-containing protein [Magnetococcales bacterium]
MPVISTFYGILILMYCFDEGQHRKPHIHARYQNFEASFAILDGECLAGTMPPNKMHHIRRWIDMHREELLINWALAVEGELPRRIKPLK